MTVGSGGASNAKDAAIDFIAGSLGGAALVYVGQPFDTVKVKMQAFPQLYSNMFFCLKETFRLDGIVKGLYAGTVPSLAANIAENSVLFAAYGYCQKFIAHLTNTKRLEDMSTFQNASAGCLAAFFSSLTLCPTELIKCKLQAMRELNPNRKQVGSLTLIKQIVKESGIKGMFNGLTATFLREMPGYFFFFGGYEYTRDLLRSPGQLKEEIGLWRTMVAGAVGGVCFWVIIFPADVIKSRMQIAQIKMSFRDTAADIVKLQGVSGLYSGLMPTVIRTIPATACLFVTVEYSKKFMNYVTNDLL